MPNPFFSGRIPPGLADKIDAYLLQTGETRSELLIRLLRAEVNDSNHDNHTDNTIDNKVLDLIARVEKLEQLVNNKADNNVDNEYPDNTLDNEPLQLSDEDWLDLSTISAQLEVLPKSISGAASKRGRDIGNDTIEFEVAGHTIYKRGFGAKASYRFTTRPEPIHWLKSWHLGDEADKISIKTPPRRRDGSISATRYRVSYVTARQFASEETDALGKIVANLCYFP